MYILPLLQSKFEVLLKIIATVVRLICIRKVGFTFVSFMCKYSLVNPKKALISSVYNLYLVTYH